MPDFTALQLVNRVRRRMHMGDAADLTDALSKALLDLVNEAKDYILETRNWDFDARHDGVLNTRSKLTSSGTTLVISDSTSYTSTAFTPDDSVARIVVADTSTNTNQAQTSYRIVSLNPATGGGTLDSPWLGTTFPSTADAYIYFAEYKLPDTVKDVLSVRYQDDDVELRFVGRNESFHKVVPRMHDRITNDPELVVVGSMVTPTYDSTGSASTPGLGLLVYPAPLYTYRLDYSYTVRHPALSASQDLENVPDSVVHDIVLEAEALAYGSSVANDPDLAKSAHQRVEVRASRHHQVNTADPRRRMRLRSLDARGGTDAGSRPVDEDVFYTP